MIYPHFEASKVSTGPIVSIIAASLSAAAIATLVTSISAIFPALSFSHAGPEYNYNITLSGSVNDVTGAIKYLQGFVANALVATTGAMYS